MASKDDVKVLEWLQRAFSEAGVELRGMDMQRVEDGFQLKLEVFADPVKLAAALVAEKPVVEIVTPTAPTMPLKGSEKPVTPSIRVSKVKAPAHVATAPETPVVGLEVFNLDEAIVDTSSNGFTAEGDGEAKKRTVKSKAVKSGETIEVTVTPITSQLDAAAMNALFAE